MHRLREKNLLSKRNIGLVKEKSPIVLFLDTTVICEDYSY